MAMKIGDAYDLNEVDPRQFEKLAGQIGFTKSPVKTKSRGAGRQNIAAT